MRLASPPRYVFALLVTSTGLRLLAASAEPSYSERSIIVPSRTRAPRHGVPSHVSEFVRARLPAFQPEHRIAPDSGDADVVKLPPFLVRAPELKTPSTRTVNYRPPPVAGVVEYADFAANDERLQREMHDLLSIADLARLGGDTAGSEKIRKETYRALIRNPTPLERAKDRCANGGRY